MTPAQLTFDDALARATDPDTSHEAAARQTPERRRRGQALVLAALGTHGPLTDFEHHAINGLVQQSAGKRRLELQRAGLVEPTGAQPTVDTLQESAHQLVDRMLAVTEEAA